MHAFGKGRGRLARGQVRPLHLTELLGHARVYVDRGIDHNWKEERLIIRHVQRAAGCEIPFAAKISLYSRLRVCRDDWHEQRAFLDLSADRRIPGVAPAQRALVEPYVEAHCAQGIANAPRGLRILRGVAKENSSLGSTHAGSNRTSSLPPWRPGLPCLGARAALIVT